jgi:periplasmic protein TonB
MDRQLFSDAGRVSSRKSRNGAVPVSIVLHAAAITAAVVLSGAVPAKSVGEPKPEPLVFRVAPTASAGQPPRSGGPVRPPTPPTSRRAPAQARAVPTAPPLVSPPDVPTIISEPALGPVPELPPFGSGDRTAAPCVDCPINGTSGDPAATGPGGPGGGGDEGEGGNGLGGPVRVSTINAPRRIRGTMPTYPEVAKRAGVTGLVVLDCTIGPDGRIRDVRVVSGNPVFHREALQAVRQWEYTRPTLNGRPISVLLMVTVQFVMPR